MAVNIKVMDSVNDIFMGEHNLEDMESLLFHRMPRG